MGLIAAAIRKQYLIAYKHDLEYKVQLITQAKMGLASSVSDLLHTGTDLNPDNPIIKQLEQRKARLNLLEKKLDLQMNAYQAKLKAIDIEIQSCDKMLNKNMKQAFSF
jgi:capsule polysaccharide export protein KpsE/RkpR